MKLRTAPLGELAEFINGAPFKPTDWEDDGARIIRIQNLTDPSKSFNRTKRSVADKLRVRPGDLLVSWSATLGVFEWAGPDEGLLNQHIFRVVPDCSRVHKEYLRHMLHGALDDMERHLHGATMKHVNRGEFLGTRIPVPPLDEQLRIAAILDQADALRAKRRVALAQLDNLTQSIFLDTFVRSDGTTGNRVPLPDAYWFQEGPGVRKWQFRTAGIKLLNVGNILPSGRLDLTRTDKFLAPDETVSKYSHFLVDDGDLVIASSGISFDTDGLLRTRGAFVGRQDLPLCMNTSTIRFKAVSGVSTLPFLKTWLQSYEFRSQISKLVTGTAQQNFGPSHLRSLTITLPPYDVQQRFSDRCLVLDEMIEVHREQKGELDSLFASLQSRAFAGKL